MNRRLRRQLVRKTKIAIMCASALYLAVGVTAIGSGNADTVKKETVRVRFDNEVKTENVYAEETVEVVKLDRFTEEERYLLAKIAMAEAEGEDLKGKALVVTVVLNRVNDKSFPDSIEEVIMQNKGNVYQFSSCQPGGRWWTNEPNEDCWEAVRMVEEDCWDESKGATYFESNGKSEWHKNNLKFLYQHGKHYFYTER